MTPTPDPATPAVEVVARAIAEAKFRDHRYDQFDNHAKDTVWRPYAVAALTALRTHLAANPHHVAALLPEGWVAVPREPTEAMLDVMHDRVRILADFGEHQCSILNDKDVWSAMLDASPPAAARTP